MQHMLSLPMFAIMPKSVRRGFVGLSRPKNSGYDGHGDANALTTTSWSSSIIRRPHTMLALNLLSQLICVTGVNQLSSVRTFFFFICCRGSILYCISPKKKKYRNKKDTDLLAHLFRSISPFVKRFGRSPLYLFPLESVRGVYTGRTHDAQGDKFVFQRMVVRQWMERAAGSGGSYGICRIILVFGSASAGTTGPNG